MTELQKALVAFQRELDAASAASPGSVPWRIDRIHLRLGLEWVPGVDGQGVWRPAMGASSLIPRTVGCKSASGCFASTGAVNQTIADAQISTMLCHLGNISYRVKSELQFDPARLRFTGHDAANKLLTRNYRDPYTVPDKV